MSEHLYNQIAETQVSEHAEDWYDDDAEIDRAVRALRATRHTEPVVVIRAEEYDRLIAERDRYQKALEERRREAEGMIRDSYSFKTRDIVAVFEKVLADINKVLEDSGE